jgi:PTS system galactitol-specific IIA component
MSNNIVKLLEPSAVKLNISAEDSKDVVTQLGNLLYKSGYVKETFSEAALAREKEMPTGLPLMGNYNAAIPHTDVEHVYKPALALATLTEPITFQNMIAPEEPVPVQLVILMALDKPKAQVEMLQEIAGVLQDTEIINRLMNAKTYDEVREILSAS